MSPTLPVPQLTLWESSFQSFAPAIVEALERWDQSVPGDASKSREAVISGAGSHDVLSIMVDASNYAVVNRWENATWWRTNAIPAARTWYRDRYVRALSSVPSTRIWTRGLLLSYLDDRDNTTLSTLVGLSTGTAYAKDGADDAALSSESTSRALEVAQALQAHVDAQIAGEEPRARIDALVSYALGHIDQWFRATSSTVPTADAVATCSALIAYYEQIRRDSEIFGAVQLAVDELWAEHWDPSARGFRTSANGAVEMELNLRVAPLFAWVYYRSAAIEYRQKHDEIFESGVTSTGYGTQPPLWSSVEGAKFNSNYVLSFSGVRWATAIPAGNEAVSDDIDAPESPILNPFTPNPPAMMLPIKAHTWQTHFSARGWRHIKDAIDAGYTLYAQPSEAAGSAQFGIDLGVVIQDLTTIDLTVQHDILAGGVNVSISLATSADGVEYTWTEGSRTRAANFRFVKCEVRVDGEGDKSLVRIGQVSVRMSLKEKTDAGMGVADAADTNGTTVLFRKPFTDIQSIHITPKLQPGVEVLGYFDFLDVPNPKEFSVYLVRRDDGARVSGEFSWMVRGV